MSSNDKAKQKLMESMRMTRAGSGKKIKQSDKKQNIAPQEVKTVKTVKAKKKISATKKTTTDTQKIAVDPFQSSRRVWPD